MNDDGAVLIHVNIANSVSIKDAIKRQKADWEATLARAMEANRVMRESAHKAYESAKDYKKAKDKQHDVNNKFLSTYNTVAGAMSHKVKCDVDAFHQYEHITGDGCECKSAKAKLDKIKQSFDDEAKKDQPETIVKDTPGL